MTILFKQSILFLGILILIFIAICILQYFLSKSKRKFIGLLLPILCFLFSVSISIGLGYHGSKYVIETKANDSYSYDSKQEMEKKIEQLTQNGVEFSVTEDISNQISRKELVCSFLFFNIGTVIFIIIYLMVQKLSSSRLNEEIDITRIQDL